MIAILTGLVGFVVLKAGRSPRGVGVGGVDSVSEECFAGSYWAIVHPVSKAPEATAATAKVIARFTENSSLRARASLKAHGQVSSIRMSASLWMGPSVSDSASLVRMLCTCFSTVPSVTHS
jgi:hypothetical protein